MAVLSGRKGQYSQASNADKMVYRMVQLSLEGTPGITFKLPEASDNAWYTVDEIGRYSCLLVHGDEFGGSAAGGFPSSRMATKCTRWCTCGMSGEMPSFKDVAHGHYHHVTTHTLANGAVVRGAGSIESGNDFALRVCAASAQPSQRMMFVDPVAGKVTCEVATLNLGCALQAAMRLMRKAVDKHGAVAVTKAAQTCEEMLRNIVKDPNEARYRTVKARNTRFVREVSKVPGATDALVAAGFQASGDVFELVGDLSSYASAHIIQVADQLRKLATDINS